LANWIRELLFTSVESLPLSVSTGASKELHELKRLYFLLLSTILQIQS